MRVVAGYCKDLIHFWNKIKLKKEEEPDTTTCGTTGLRGDLEDSIASVKSGKQGKHLLSISLRLK